MKPPRITIARLMFVIVLAGTLLAVFRAFAVAGLVSLLPFGLSAFFSRSASSDPPTHRRALAVGAVGTILLPFLVAIWINHELWGFTICRPAVDRRIVVASRIETITYVETQPDAAGRLTFTGKAVESVDSLVQEHSEEGDYYVLEGRVLRELTARHMLPPEPLVMSAGSLRGLYQVLDDTGRLEKGEGRYARAKELRGIVVEALDDRGRRLVFAGVCGREVSNDHYPYYEFLFRSQSRTGPLKLLSFHRFYYDVAGIEGAEWPVFMPIFVFIGLIPTLAIQSVVLWR